MKESNQNKISKSDDQYALKMSKRFRAIEHLGGKCVKCGDSNFIHLDFHHVDPKTKQVMISRASQGRLSLVQDELVKCVLLCGNCHAEHHYKNSRNGQITSKMILDKSLGKCKNCGYRGSNLASLEFHHTDPSIKKFAISHALLRKIKVSVQEINDEIEKCVVICRNCHKEKHFDTAKHLRLKSVIEHKTQNHKEVQAKINLDVVKSMLETGLSQQEISRKLKASKGSISGIAKQLGLRKEIKKQYYDKTCEFCSSEFTTDRKNQQYCSRSCSRSTVQKPTKEELLNLLESSTLKEIGKIYGVSSVAVFKWKKSYNIL